jgi:hypothetical protein
MKFGRGSRNYPTARCLPDESDARDGILSRYQMIGDSAPIHYFAPVALRRRLHTMRRVLLFVPAVLFLLVACGESEALPSADIVPTPEFLRSPPSTDPRVVGSSLAIRDFADAFNKHQWTAVSRFVHPLISDRFKDGVEHAAQSQAQLQLQVQDFEAIVCRDDSCGFRVRWSMSPEEYCNPLFRKSGSGLSNITVFLDEGQWVVREITTFGPTC